MFPALGLNQEDDDGGMGARHKMRRQADGIREEVDDDDNGDATLVDGVLLRSQDAAGATAAVEISEISDSSSDVSEDHGESGNRPRLGSRSAEALIAMENEGPSELVSNLRGGGGTAGEDLLSIPGVFSQEQGRRETLGNGGQNEDMMVR